MMPALKKVTNDYTLAEFGERLKNGFILKVWIQANLLRHSSVLTTETISSRSSLRGCT